MTLKNKMDIFIKIIRCYSNLLGYNNSNSKAPYKYYISMGNFCLPRSFLTEWGIKPRKSEGELSLPFDLLHIDPIALNYYFLFSFRHFFSNVEFNKEENVFKSVRGHYRLFNHDKDCGDNFTMLMNRYKNRIANLKKIMKSKENILFVQACENCYMDVDNLYEILRFYRKNNPFKLILLDLCCSKSINKKNINKNITIIKEPYPTDDYLWWSKDCRKSDAGIDFENRLRKKIEGIIHV